jgi:hypothetical protein
MGRKLGLCFWVLFACALAARADTTTSFTPDKDTTLFQAGNTFSSGAGSTMYIGRTNQPAGQALRRALIHFNLSSLPAGATITSATLKLSPESTSNGQRTLVLHRVLQDWGQGTSVSSGGRGAPASNNDATWIYRVYNSTTPSNSLLWGAPGGSFSATNSASALTPATFTALTFASNSTLVGDLNFWLANPTSNFGWEILGDESTSKTAKIIYSREFSTAANRPTLTVTYAVPEPGALVLLVSALSTFSLRRRTSPR